MSWLKKFGGIVLKASEIAAGVAPFAQTMLPGEAAHIVTVSHDIAQVADVVAQVEAVGQALALNGAQKLTAASPLVAQIVLKSSVLAGKKVKDPDLFKKACDEIAGGVADLLNSVEE